jgi:hypothetical protein
MIDEKFTPDVPEEEDNDGKSEPPATVLVSTGAYEQIKQLSHEV